MSIDDGGAAFGGKQTQYRIYGTDEKAKRMAEQIAKAADGQTKAIVISEEDSKKIGAFSLEVPGMSLRDYYAGEAMQGMIPELMKANVLDSKNGLSAQIEMAKKKNLKEFAEYCFDVADAMIARKRETEKGDDK
jgi:hypothetical protein